MFVYFLLVIAVPALMCFSSAARAQITRNYDGTLLHLGNAHAGMHSACYVVAWSRVCVLVLGCVMMFGELWLAIARCEKDIWNWLSPPLLLHLSRSLIPQSTQLYRSSQWSRWFHRYMRAFYGGRLFPTARVRVSFPLRTYLFVFLYPSRNHLESLSKPCAITCSATRW